MRVEYPGAVRAPSVVSLTFLSTRNSDDPHLTSPWSGGGTVKPHIRRDTRKPAGEEPGPCELFSCQRTSSRQPSALGLQPDTPADCRGRSSTKYLHIIYFACASNLVSMSNNGEHRARLCNLHIVTNGILGLSGIYPDYAGFKWEI